MAVTSAVRALMTHRAYTSVTLSMSGNLYSSKDFLAFDSQNIFQNKNSMSLYKLIWIYVRTDTV